jgi:hypothetical protein
MKARAAGGERYRWSWTAMARMWAFWKGQVALRPAAASIAKSTPADVGAANRPARSASCHASHVPHTAGGSRMKTK